jgi:hypothetical protein
MGQVATSVDLLAVNQKLDARPADTIRWCYGVMTLVWACRGAGVHMVRSQRLTYPRGVMTTLGRLHRVMMSWLHNCNGAVGHRSYR